MMPSQQQPTRTSMVHHLRKAKFLPCWMWRDFCACLSPRSISSRASDNCRLPKSESIGGFSDAIFTTGCTTEPSRTERVLEQRREQAGKNVSHSDAHDIGLRDAIAIASHYAGVITHRNSVGMLGGLCSRTLSRDICREDIRVRRHEA